MIVTVAAAVPSLTLCWVSSLCGGGRGGESCRDRRWWLPEHVGQSPERVGALCGGDGLDQGTATVIDPFLDNNACL